MSSRRNYEIQGAYPSVCPQNIAQNSGESRLSINGLRDLEAWTENPRVGGSIPPLATIKSKRDALD
jgi:hypothetical protein